MLDATFMYAGYADYWSGHVEHKDEDYSDYLLYTYYGRDTSLRDIIDELVEASMSGLIGEPLPEEVTQDDVRKALLGMLNEVDLADYFSGEIAECSVQFAIDTDIEDDDAESPIFIALLTYHKPE